MKKNLLVHRALTFGLCCLAISTACQLSLNVSTKNGLVVVHKASNRSEVNEYLGIPFAQPPLRSLRFSPPEKYIAPGGPCLSVLVASKYSAACPQTDSKPVAYPLSTPQQERIVANFANENGESQSEDCLYLNVWSKATDRTRKPVLVFFYGGRWSIGATNTPFYDGQYFAHSQDVVVVTTNFRTNIFGYPGAPGEPQNLGLRDQRLAVEWVRDNIAAFNGNPEKITIFGQSSGSVAVDFWAYAYQSDPIVAGLISHSGDVFSFPINSPELSYENWYNASAILGCGSSGDLMTCMRSRSFTAILAAAAKVPPPPASSQARSQPSFHLMVDNDTVFRDYYTRSVEGNFAKIPMLLGNNDNEAGYYKIAAYARGTVLPDSAWAAFNDQDFTCATALTTSFRRKASVPTWRFRYFGDWDNLRLYPTSGAYHGSDLEMVFGASQDVSGLPDIEAEKDVQEVMMRAWATFANDPDEGLKEELRWPVYDADRETLIALAYNNSPAVEFLDPSIFEGGCSAYLAGYKST